MLRPFGVLALTALGQVSAVDPSQAAPAASTDFFSLIRQAGWTVWLVLFVLLLFSAASWGIIIYKQRQFRRATRQSAQFLEIFRRSSRFSEVQSVCASLG